MGQEKTQVADWKHVYGSVHTHLVLGFHMVQKKNAHSEWTEKMSVHAQ